MGWDGCAATVVWSGFTPVKFETKSPSFFVCALYLSFLCVTGGVVTVDVNSSYLTVYNTFDIISLGQVLGLGAKTCFTCCKAG